MIESPREKIVHIFIGLAACLSATEKELSAQTTPPALIVVANASDAECVKRIGCEHVHVEGLFDPEAGVPFTNYEACNERFRGLLQFRLYVFRANTCCPGERFWRERLAVANPKGELHRLSHLPRGAAIDCDHQIQQATEIHRALAAALPEYRKSLDAQLKAELHRVLSLRHSHLQLAVRK